MLETSEVSNSSPVAEQDDNVDETFIDGSMSSRWYRLLRRPTWAWQGRTRSRWSRPWPASPWGGRAYPRALPGYHQGYVPGNWVYEWSQLAGRYFNRGRELVAQGERAAALKSLLKAVRYYPSPATPI